MENYRNTWGKIDNSLSRYAMSVLAEEDNLRLLS
jgi:hypothetical protein